MPHWHRVVCKRCGNNYVYSHQINNCTLPLEIEVDECALCVSKKEQPTITSILHITLKKCPYCGLWVYDDETGNYHILSCSEAKARATHK
jgi:predicted nucleic-acid-binding Zn-ribbon protein